MTFDECVRFYEDRYHLPRGSTLNNAIPGLNFTPCECSRKDTSYRGPGDNDYFDFIAVTPDNAVVYVGAQRKITYGPNGYHDDRADTCGSI